MYLPTGKWELLIVTGFAKTGSGITAKGGIVTGCTIGQGAIEKQSIGSIGNLLSVIKRAGGIDTENPRGRVWRRPHQIASLDCTNVRIAEDAIIAGGAIGQRTVEVLAVRAVGDGHRAIERADAILIGAL